jgi:hypothetical protein
VNVTARGIRVWFWPILAAPVWAGCSNAPVASPAATTTAPIGHTQSAIRDGCQHLAQLEHQVSEALDSSDAAARLKSISSGRAVWPSLWQSVESFESAPFSDVGGPPLIAAA